MLVGVSFQRLAQSRVDPKAVIEHLGDVLCPGPKLEHDLGSYDIAVWNLRCQDLE
jgi:hypothetical protein